ncbi:hypothetical protein EVAR_90762_1 [Eumeta japonica]|uniref:Uncharacterized protein n=1 Tax=Eumeta variegata TaxID=151549 RepID=A0A4C1SG39_EUMVA|nr:hypothetical protein EVAR_90762_1 [Eumeta japonica]
MKSRRDGARRPRAVDVLVAMKYHVTVTPGMNPAGESIMRAGSSRRVTAARRYAGDIVTPTYVAQWNIIVQM